MVDEGWGRRAVDFAMTAEPGNSREYVFVHSRLGVGPGDRLLDVACGSGLAIELARMRGAECAGIDASHRLIDLVPSQQGEVLDCGDSDRQTFLIGATVLSVVSLVGGFMFWLLMKFKRRSAKAA